MNHSVQPGKVSQLPKHMNEGIQRIVGLGHRHIQPRKEKRKVGESARALDEHRIRDLDVCEQECGLGGDLCVCVCGRGGGR